MHVPWGGSLSPSSAVWWEYPWMPVQSVWQQTTNHNRRVHQQNLMSTGSNWTGCIDKTINYLSNRPDQVDSAVSAVVVYSGSCNSNHSWNYVLQKTRIIWPARLRVPGWTSVTGSWGSTHPSTPTTDGKTKLQFMHMLTAMCTQWHVAVTWPSLLPVYSFDVYTYLIVLIDCMCFDHTLFIILYSAIQLFLLQACQ